METIKNIISSAQFWGPFLGALIAVAGVLLTNRANSNRLLLQIRQETAREAKYKRDDLKRGVFLEAVKTVHLGLALLSKSTEPSSDWEKEAQSFSAQSTSFSEIHLVADSETIKSMLAVSESMSKSIMLALPVRFEMMCEKANADNANKIAEDYRSKSAEMNRLMTEYNLTGRDDPRYFNNLQKSFKFFSEQDEQYQAKQLGHINRMRSFQAKLTGIIVEQRQLLAPVFADALQNLRRELGFRFNKSEYVRALTQSNEEVSNMLEQFMVNVSAKFTARTSGETG